MVIPFLDDLSEEAKISQSVNTIYKDDNKIIGDNTDIEGFKLGLEETGLEIKNKKASNTWGGRGCFFNYFCA